MKFLKNKDLEWQENNGQEEILFEVQDYCEQIKESSRRIAQTKREYKAVNEYLEDIRIITELGGEKKQELVSCANRIRSLCEDKEAFRESHSKIPEEKYRYIQMNEKELPQILKDMHKDEDYLQKLKVDLNNIEGEKAGLGQERKQYETYLSWLKNGMFVVIFTAVAVIAGMSYFHLNSEYDFTIGMLLTGAAAAAIIAVLVSLYQGNIRNIKLTDLKMNKAVKLLNKYRLLFVNAKSRLDYQYEKIGVRDSYELNNDWRIYLTVQKERQAYLRMSDELYQAQKRFSEILESLHLYDASVWNHQLEAFSDDKICEEIADNLEKRKKGLRKTLDFNQREIEKCKERVKELTNQNPNLVPKMLKMLEEENAF